MQPPDGYLTIAEAVQKYKISLSTLCTRCNKGKIKGALQLERFWFVPDISFDQIDEESGLLIVTIDPGYMTVGAAARYIGITPDQIMRRGNKKRIPDFKRISDKFWVVPLSWVEDYKRELTRIANDYITISQAAKILEVPRTVVAYWASSKKIDGVLTKPGATQQHWYIPWSWIEAEAAMRGKKCSRAAKVVDHTTGSRKTKIPEGYLAIAEAARKYNIPLDALNAKINTGEISGAINLSRCWYIPITWLEENKGKLAPIPRGYVTLSEAARRLGLSRDQIDWLKKSGKIPGIKHVSDYFWAVPTCWVRSYKKRLQPKPVECVTINQAAEMLGLSRTRIVALRNQGKIDGAVCVCSTKKLWYIPLSWIEAEKVRRVC